MTISWKNSRQSFDGTSQWPINDWITSLAKGGGPKKRFQCCFNPNSSKHFLFSRAIQGHSGGNLVDPALQDNVLLLEDFTEYIYHVGNVSEIHSIIRNGFIPRGRSLKKGQAIRVFDCSEPDGRRSNYGRNSMRLGQAKDRSIHIFLGPHQKFRRQEQFKTRSKKRTAVLSNTIARNRSVQHTACDLY